MDLTRRILLKMAAPFALLGTVSTGVVSASAIAAEKEDEKVNFNKDTFDQSEDSLLRAAQLIRSRLKTSPGKSITVMGDSISHGAQAAGPLYLHSWVNILKRCINNEFQSTSYGYAPTATINGFREIHEVLFLPNLSSWKIKEGESAHNIPQGLTYTSSRVGDSAVMSVPTFQGVCRIHYVRRSDGSRAKVIVNGSPTGEFTTVGDFDVSHYHDVEMVDRKGTFKIEIINESGGILELIGFSFLSNNPDDIRVDNFGFSGRRLAYYSNSAIDAVFDRSGLIIMALGYNDSQSAEDDPSYASTFKKRINYIIKKSKETNVPVIVADFCWHKDKKTLVRTQLRKLGYSTSGIYLPFPDYFSLDGNALDNKTRVNTLHYFAEGAHPNQEGHKLIAEAMAKAMALSVSSKEQALKHHDWWYPLQLLNTGVDNRTTSYDTISAVRREGEHLLLRFDLNGIGSNTERGVQGGWDLKSGITNKRNNIIPLSYRLDGSTNGTLSIGENGKITAHPNNNNDTRQHENIAIIM
ncbi:SGNH/GDSL hydrolase family protein [Citrobacter amalonaticus]|uniref:SGNH/GDSL hydrolase family protein n=1 Tax=Citrobacter amalonaticus TaxID=35703 RepID=UPI001E44DEC9|nr:SGNH/GDSL hydrolase family protein [Citrobacter amalonaticus]